MYYTDMDTVPREAPIIPQDTVESPAHTLMRSLTERTDAIT